MNSYISQCGKKIHSGANLVFHSLSLGLVVQFVLAGICFALLFPVFRTPDEEAHYKTGLSNYAWITRGQSTYCGYSMDLRNLATQPDGAITTQSLETDRLQELCENHITYGWVLNYPSVLLASAFTSDRANSKKSALLRFYLSRFLNGFFVAITMLRLVQLMSRWGPRAGSFLILCFCLSPLFLQQSWSVTADVPVNLLGLQLAIVAIYFDRLDGWDLGIFALTAIIACSSKPIIAPLIPAVLIIAYGLHDQSARLSWSYLKNLFKQRFFLVGMAAAIFGVATAFLQIGAEDSKGHPHFRQQLQFAMENPGKTYVLLQESLKFFFSESIHFFAGALGYFKVATPDYMIRLFPKLLSFALLTEMAIFGAFLWQRLKIREFGDLLRGRLQFVAAGSVLTAITLYVSALIPVFIMFLVWTPVGSTRVEGVQVRYFYPVVLAGIGCIGGLAGLVKLPTAQIIPSNRETVRARTSLLAVFALMGLGYWLSLLYNIVKFYYQA
jgi:hypothetical protein